jgi:inner membrane protein
MDPLSQAVIGAGLAMSFARKHQLRAACLAGVLGGMVPDLDVLIRSSTDPLLGIEYHRHFTHSLIFIPVIGALVGLLLSVFPRFRDRRKLMVLFATLGAATHGLLDACTSYGTQLYWPFSNERVAWHMIGIIDPIPTLTAVVLVVVAAVRQVVWPARASFGFFVGYLLLCIVQRDRARAVQQDLIAGRGHQAVRESVKPTIFNNVVFRSVYKFEGRYYVDGIRVGWLGSEQIRTGVSVPAFDPELASSAISASSPQLHDLRRFAWFSDYFLALMPDGLISDVRYSMLPQSADPMWGIYLHPDRPQDHVTYWVSRDIDRKESGDHFRFMFFGNQN